MLVFTIQEESVGKRADAYLATVINNVSRSVVHKLFEQGKVACNGKNIKPSYKLKLIDKLEVDYDDSLQTIPDIDLSIIYQDDDCFVVNKPIGVLSHSKGAFNPEGTVGTFIQQIAPNMDGERSGIVHRLDRATSGVIICAKTPEALSWLQKQFSQRKVKKTYLAVVSGHLEPKEAIIEIPIERNPKQPQTFRAGNMGKPATTNYKVLKQLEGYDYVELKPFTGRTHQLRVHMDYLAHPIVGDTLYNGEKADRLMLHANTLEITLPNRDRKVFTIDPPTDFDQFIQDNS